MYDDEADEADNDGMTPLSPCEDEKGDDAEKEEEGDGRRRRRRTVTEDDEEEEYKSEDEKGIYVLVPSSVLRYGSDSLVDFCLDE